MSINDLNINSKSTQDQVYIEAILADIEHLSGDDLNIVWMWTSALVKKKGRL